MSFEKNRIVIIGATSAIAEHCARLWVATGPVNLVLVGRDRVKTEQVAADLRVRSSLSSIKTLEADFVDPTKIRKLVNGIVTEGVVDIVLIAHGSLPDQPRCQQDLSLCSNILNINGISPVLFAEAFAEHMQKNNSGTLVLIGSVAGDRGRKSNYIYGAAKGLIARYAQGLQHRFADTGVKVVLVKPGPTDTPMTAHLKQQTGRLASVEYVARLIFLGVNQGKSVVYAPKRWRLIMLVIRHLPSFLFNRMNI
ncbi:MAG: SDR family NAD(P)-dependent oxidoreductase [Methylococcales bacterium]